MRDTKKKSGIAMLSISTISDGNTGLTDQPAILEGVIAQRVDQSVVVGRLMDQRMDKSTIQNEFMDKRMDQSAIQDGFMGWKLEQQSIGGRSSTMAEKNEDAIVPPCGNRNHPTLELNASRCSTPPKLLTQVICSLVLAMTHVGVGTVNGFSGVTLPQLTQPYNKDIYLEPNSAALFGSIVPLGIAFGSLSCGPFISRVGHRRTLSLTLPIALLFWLLQAYTSSLTLLIISRAAVGFMAGIVYSSSTAYSLEVTHKDYRGVLFSATPVIRQSGSLFIYALGSTPLTWRQMAVVCGLVSTVLPFIGLFFFPESPRWLLTRGREDDALKSMVFFRGQEYDSHVELKAVQKELDESGRGKDLRKQFCQLFQTPVRNTFLMLVVLCFITNFNGSYAITTYLVPIFQVISLDFDAYTSAVLVGGIRVVGTIFEVVLIERLGRRPLHLSTYFVMSLTVASIGVYLYAQDIEWVSNNLSWVPLVSVLIYTFFMGLGQPVLMMMIGELLPTNVRSLGVSSLVFVTYIGCFLLTQIFYLMIDALGMYGTLWTYGVCSMIVFIISLFILPETRGLSLEEITERGKHRKNDS